eukprot:532696_1
MMIDMTQLKFLDVEAADGVTIALLYMKLKMMMMDDDESEDDDEPEDESNSNSQPSDWDVSDGVSVHNLSYSDDEPNDNKDDDEQNDNKEQESDDDFFEQFKVLKIGAISIAPERFNTKKKNKTIQIWCGGGKSVLETSVLFPRDVVSDMGAFGNNVCKTKEQIYHWKVQIVEGNDIHLGVIFSNKCKQKSYESDWWSTEEGYSYCSNGKVYHSRKYKKYGKKYGAGDVIDVWLNLKKYNISFAKNDEKYGT